MVIFPDFPLFAAVNVTPAEPRSPVAFKWNLAEPSRSSSIWSDWVAPPTTCSPLPTFTATSMAAPLPEPLTLLATPTETSNSSPGAATMGTLGESTKSPRTIAFLSAMPTASGATATAITRRVPLK